MGLSSNSTNAKLKPTYTKNQVEDLKTGLVELASQEKNEFGARELVLEALPEIRAALEKHSYRYLAEWMSKNKNIEITEGSLKQYVSQAIRRQAEEIEQSAASRSRKNSTRSGSNDKSRGKSKETGVSEKPSSADTPGTLPQGSNSRRKTDY